MENVVLIVWLMLSNGTVLTSPSFVTEGKADCIVRGIKITESYTGFNDIKAVKYGCFTVHEDK